MKYIRKFQGIKKEDVPVVGGKGANLGEMYSAGLPVPNGFCITANAFDEYMEQNNFQQQPSAYSDDLRLQIENGNIPLELEQEIAKCHVELGQNIRLAVRSSATTEDLPEASFAGQQETYLNVIGEKQLYIAIKKCFASLYSPRAVSYRKQSNFDAIKVSLAVVVQEMVESEISGVLFTADPISQDTGQMMLNASWGLGEAIVSGKVTPDIYMYDKSQKSITDKKLGEKDICICYSTIGIEERRTPAEQKSRFCLTKKQALEIFEMGKKIEQHYGSPQDIEWAISKGNLYLLQSRPITTLDKPKNNHIELSASQKAILNDWIEHCPIPLYPLDVEPCKIVEHAKARVFRELGISIGGELRMDEDGVLSITAGKMRLYPKIVKLPFLLRSFTDYAVNSSHTDSEFYMIKRQLNENASVDVSQLSTNALVQQLKDLIDLSEKIAYVRFRYNIFPSVAISKLLYSTLQKIDKGINEFDLLSNLPYKTWEMNIALKKLAVYIQDHPEMKKAISNPQNIDSCTISDFRDRYPDFSIKLQNFLNEFGWKSTASYCAFGSVSWFEDMSSLFSLIKVLLYSDKNDAEHDKYQIILTKIQERFSMKKAVKVRKKIEEIRGYHVNREKSLYLIEMCYGLVRRIAFELNNRFPEVFEQPKDILFLTLDEVYTLPNSFLDYKKKIVIRKASRPQNKNLWDSISIGSKMNNQNTLTGVSGNRGVCRGRVKKILTLEEFDKIQPGDILVCRYTDPSWTPLFVLASAVVSDTGGPLSHSAIVAREYDIPAVLGCGNATDSLQDGQVIIVDGDKGIVQIIS